MDGASVLGLALGVSAILLGQILEGGALSAIFQPAAAVLVFGGTLGATLLSVPAADARRALGLMRLVFRPPHQSRLLHRVRTLMDLSGVARRNGLGALDGHPHARRDRFLEHALQHVVDGTPPQALREMLEVSLDQELERDTSAARVFEAAGGYSPTLGILGAVLGLMHVLRNLDDPARLGEGIAVAFVATVYGVALANLVCLPIARKLRRRVDHERTLRELTLEGVLAIQDGLAPRVVETRLEPFLQGLGSRAS